MLIASEGAAALLDNFVSIRVSGKFALMAPT